MKQAQISVFIILGAFLIILVLMLVVFSSNVPSEESPAVTSGLDVDPVKRYVESCLADIGPFGLYAIGVQGGYIDPLPIAVDTAYSDIGVAYQSGVGLLISIDLMEQQFSHYIEQELIDCVRFDNFPGLSVTAGTPRASTTIMEDAVFLEVDYPITIRKGERDVTIDSFTERYDVRLGKIYEVVSHIVEDAEQDPKYIDLTYIKESGFDFSIIPAEGNTLIYIIVDSESVIKSAPYVFIFANRYETLDIDTQLQYPPEIDDMEDVDLEVDEELELKVNVIDKNGDNLTYNIYSTLNVEISKEGIITYKARENDIGQHSALIDVTDSTGLKSIKTILITVE